MLSKILSIFFRIGFVLVLILAALHIISQVRQNKVAFFAGKYEVILATPGVDVLTTRQLGSEHFAPDTTVRFRTVNPKGDSIVTVSGTSHPSYRKLALEAVPIDSARTVILDSQENFFPGDTVVTHYEGGTVTRRKWVPLHIFGGVLEKSEPKQILRVLPGSNKQHFLFTLFDIFYYGSIVFIYFFLMRLFSNFGKKEYFTASNIRILMTTGCLVLVPQIVNHIFYLHYSPVFYPAKGLISNGDYKIFAIYNMTPNLHFFEIITGLGLIILSYGFKKGLLLKIDSSLNI